MKRITIPNGIRKGQMISNFLDYYEQYQMMDIFYIPDETFDKIWKEYIKMYAESIAKSKRGATKKTR